MSKTIAIVCCVGLVSLCGCDGYKSENSKDIDRAWTRHGMDICTKVVEIEGHKYILMDGYRAGAIIHAESCSCKKSF